MEDNLENQNTSNTEEPSKDSTPAVKSKDGIDKFVRYAVVTSLLLLLLFFAYYKSSKPIVPQVPSSPSSAEIAQLKSDLNDLRNKVSMLELSNNLYKKAFFDPTGDKGYQRLDTDAGLFLVIMDNVTPYLDGQKITLSIGNCTSAKYDGFKLHAKWGPRYDYTKYDPSTYDSWKKSLKEKDISLTDSLRPGSWNKVNFTLSPAKSDEFGYLELNMSTNSVLLQN